MTIATLPPQNHINALRSFVDRIRRTRTVPNAQEFAHAEENLRALEAVFVPARQKSEPMPTSDDIIQQRQEEWRS